jgi:hypothetical protein
LMQGGRYERIEDASQEVVMKIGQSALLA